MTFKRQFRFQIVCRILALAISIFLLIYLMMRTTLYATYLIFGAAIIYQIYLLIRFIDKTNRDLTRFFQSIKYTDFSQSYSIHPADRSFRELNSALSEIFSDLQKFRKEKEEQFRYLQTIVKHIGIGLLVFLPDGTVDLINMAAKRLLNCTGLKNISTLAKTSPELVDVLFKLKPGEKSLVKIEMSGESLQLVLYATEFRMREDIYKLVSLQNIRSELEEQEMEAWKKMIRILTHEIMNSITPISSLAETVGELVDGIKEKSSPRGKEIVSSEIVDDIHSALKTIQKRSLGLQHFVSAYRNLTLIPKPQFKIFPIIELFNHTGQLMEPRMAAGRIQFIFSVEPESLELTADPELIEQVLINLLMNAIDAVKGRDKPCIEMKANMDERGYPVIKIIDNGAGIIKEAREKLFVPFFTTKKRGSGIGLSLSRQIMRIHNGGISVITEPDRGSIFTLRF